MYKSRNNFVSKFVEKQLKYRIMFNDILNFVGLCYRDASFTTLYFVVIELKLQKINKSSNYIT